MLICVEVSIALYHYTSSVVTPIMFSKDYEITV